MKRSLKSRKGRNESQADETSKRPKAANFQGDDQRNFKFESRSRMGSDESQFYETSKRTTSSRNLRSRRGSDESQADSSRPRVAPPVQADGFSNSEIKPRSDRGSDKERGVFESERIVLSSENDGDRDKDCENGSKTEEYSTKDASNQELVNGEENEKTVVKECFVRLSRIETDREIDSTYDVNEQIDKITSENTDNNHPSFENNNEESGQLFCYSESNPSSFENSSEERAELFCNLENHHPSFEISNEESPELFCNENNFPSSENSCVKSAELFWNENDYLSSEDCSEDSFQSSSALAGPSNINGKLMNSVSSTTDDQKDSSSNTSDTESTDENIINETAKKEETEDKKKRCSIS